MHGAARPQSSSKLASRVISVEYSVAIGSSHDDSSANVSVVSLNTKMSPDHVTVQLIVALIICVMHVVPAFDRTDSLIQHPLQHVDDVAHLHFDNEDEASTMAWSQIRPV
jgi:hypothetical protein